MKNNKFIWSIFTLLLTLLLFITFFGKGLITNLDSNFLSTSSGDLTKDVYTTYYHVKYDTCYTRNNAMNYPYGEHYRYTGSQSFISIPLRILEDLGAGDLSKCVLPLINLHVILSVFLCALFLFLLFRELKLPNWVSMLGAVAITFLSPQIHRMGGHITLSYLFIIPVILYILARHYTKPKFIDSIFLGLILIWSAFAHPYYLMFFAFSITFYWLYIFLNEKERFGGNRKIIISYLIQFIIPVICFFVLSGIGNIDTDRTNIPNDFYMYRARIEGILFPYGRAYFTDESNLFANVRWEARSYIGIIALIVLLWITVVFFRKLFKKQYSLLLKVTDNTVLNIFFWTSVLLFIFASGVPINWFPQKFLNYIGPIAQLRGMARFSWLLYYVINIIAVYLIYNFAAHRIKKSWLKYGLIILMFSLYAAEDYFNTLGLKQQLNNQIPEWTDYDNKMDQNQWVYNIDINKFQSILPLPVFNVGAEQLYLPDKDNMFSNSVYVSMKTGLPLNANYTSRSSIKQSYNNIELSWNPWRLYPILADMQQDKDILVIKASGSESLNTNELRIIENSDYMFSYNGIDFYSISIDSLHKLCFNYNKQQQEFYKQNKKIQFNNSVYSDDPLHNFYFKTWDEYKSAEKFQGTGSFEAIVNRTNILYDSLIPFSDSRNIEISFWISNITDDLYGRTKWKVVLTDSDGNKYTKIDFFISYYLNAINNGWGLIKDKFELPENTVKITISLYNKEMLAKKVYIDNLLIRSLNTNVISEEDGNFLINNFNVRFDKITLSKINIEKNDQE